MSETATGGAAASQAAKQLTRQQKAAAVVISLGAEKASQLYQYMDPDDVEQITLEVAKLGYVDAATTEDVLNEYYQMCLTNKAVTEGGLEYARAVLEKAFGEQAADNLLEKVTKSLKNREFSFLNKAEWQVAVCRRCSTSGLRRLRWCSPISTRRRRRPWWRNWTPIPKYGWWRASPIWKARLRPP